MESLEISFKQSVGFWGVASWSGSWKMPSISTSHGGRRRYKVVHGFTELNLLHRNVCQCNVKAVDVELKLNIREAFRIRDV